MSKNMLKIFMPHQFHNLTFKNRIFMSNMTRCRAELDTFKANKRMETYYTQRSSAGLIFSEPLIVSQEGMWKQGCPGIWNDSFIEGWKNITDKVHEKGGLIFATLSHGGRCCRPEFNGGLQPIAPSPILLDNPLYIHYKLCDPYPPKEMTNDEILDIIDKFHSATIRCKKANFDGILLHASSGALVETFIKSGSNIRTDKWGGNGGCDFAFDIIKCMIDVYGKELVSIKISPVDQFNECFEENPIAKFSYFISKLNKLGIGLIEIKETDDLSHFEKFEIKPSEQIPSCIATFNQLTRKNAKLIANFGTKNIKDGIYLLESDNADFISCASFYISNPNLINKLAEGRELKLPEAKSFYSNDDEGYIDFI